jgi:hypothetical protein
VKILSYVLILFIISCSSSHNRAPEGKSRYYYRDISGEYNYDRDTKSVKNKVVTRYQLSLSSDQTRRPLEKSIVVSEKGAVKVGKNNQVILRPMISQYTVWLEGKKHFSQLKTLVKEKSLEITMDSPEAKWKGVKKIKFPKGVQFCFFSQLPECLAHTGMMSKMVSRPHEKFPVTVIWDNYPYLLDQLTNIQNSVFARAEAYLDEEEKSLYRIAIDISGQTIFYHFSKSWELVRMSWVVQGITLMTPSEAAKIDRE